MVLVYRVLLPLLITLIFFAHETRPLSTTPAPAAPPPFTLGLTNKRVDMAPWPYTVSAAPVRKEREDSVAKKLVLRGEFIAGSFLSDKRINEIADVCGVGGTPGTTTTTGGGNGNYMSLMQALSLRKQLLVSKIISSGWRLDKDMPRVRQQYKSGRDISDIAYDLDQPAMALLRNILTLRAQERYPELDFRDLKAFVRAALRNEPVPSEDELEGVSAPPTTAAQPAAHHELLTPLDVVQLERAKLCDQMSFSEENVAERDMSQAWENALYTHLDSAGVKYLSEQELKDAGCRSTPDVVMCDDVYINGQPVKWIDCKCYYGSSQSKHFHSRLEKQINRYNLEFGGRGAICYRLGFSKELASKLEGSALLLDRGLLNDDLLSQLPFME